VLRLLNATLHDGSTADVTIDGDRISTVDLIDPGKTVDPVDPGKTVDPVDPGKTVDPGASPLATSDGIDLTGYLLTSAFAEPHAHLDKALTADLVSNPAGDLIGAIEAWLAYRTTITKADFASRATAAALLGLANGCTAIRTHVDIGPDIGTTGVEALLEVKAALAPTLDLQLVGLIGGLTGPSAADAMAVLRDALSMGLDVVGGVPHREDDPAEAIERAFAVASEYERPVDLHADEALDPTAHDLELMADRVTASGFEHQVTASHCVALGMKPEADQRRIAEATATAGINVITLPQTNLYLQARDVAVAPPRGLTALGPLEQAGVTVAAGGDNLQDPFCIVGRADPMETASLLVMAGHLSAADAYRLVSSRARSAMGLEPTAVTPGGVAELVALPAPSLRQAVAVGPPGRLVIHRGVVVHDGRTTTG
jgi:cytosine deaminase